MFVERQSSYVNKKERGPFLSRGRAAQEVKAYKVFLCPHSEGSKKEKIDNIQIRFETVIKRHGPPQSLSKGG